MIERIAVAWFIGCQAGTTTTITTEPAATATAAAPSATSAPPTTSAPTIHPTLEEIFRPPRLLGVKPRDLAISASGRFVLWRHTAVDAEQPKLGWWIAPSDGSADPRELFPAEPRVDLQWLPSGDELLLFRNDWIERLDVASQRPPVPLFECGESRGRLVFTRDGRLAVFVAGEEADLWVLDLVSGARWTPAATLTSRGRWFELLEECGSIALFAAPSAAATPAAAGLPPVPAAPAPVAAPPIAGAPKAAANDAKERPKRVLWIVPLESPNPGASPPLKELRETKLEESGRVEVSADGRVALISQSEFDAKRQLVVADYLTDTVTTVPVRNDLAGDLPPKTTLSFFDLSKNERLASPIDEGNRFYLLDTAWSPTGERLLAQRLSSDFKVRQILVVEPLSGRSWPLFAERDDAWIGGPLTFAAWRGDGAEVVFSSEQTGFEQLYAVSADGGAVRPLTIRAGEVQEVVSFAQGNRLLVQTNERDSAERSLLAVNLVDDAVQVVATPRDGCVGDYVVSQDGSRAAFLFESLGVPADVWTIGLEEGATAVQLSDTVPDALRELALPPAEIVTFPSGDDGTTLRALLYRPEPFDPARKVPAVVFVHGAGYLQNVTRSMTEYPANLLFHHRLARLGFAVLDVDYRHSAGYGRKFRTDIYGFMGGKDLDDEIAGVKYLESLGFVDASRVGVYGGSYGGFMTLMALFTKPDVFACGAALRSVTDWRTYNSGYTNPRLGDPKRDAENYRRSSPIDHAEGLKRPLLILHGMKDSNVFAQDSIRLIEKLIQLGKEFDAMLYPSQDHGFTDPDCWIDEYRRIERLFMRELRPEPAR